MGQAAALLGWNGASAARRLRRFIVAKEGRTGKTIAVRMKAQRLVTEALLRHHCPELFDTKEEMAAQLRSIFRKQDAAITGIRNDVNDLRDAMERVILAQRQRGIGDESGQKRPEAATAGAICRSMGVDKCELSISMRRLRGPT